MFLNESQTESVCPSPFTLTICTVRYNSTNLTLHTQARFDKNTQKDMSEQGGNRDIIVYRAGLEEG